MNLTNVSDIFVPLKSETTNDSRYATNFGIGAIAIVIVGFVGAVVFLYILWKEQKQRLSIKAAFINLCVSVLLFCVFSGPFQALTFITQDRNFLADPRYFFLCQLNSFLNAACIYVVVLCHAIIAVNRFLVVIFYDKPFLLNSRTLLGILLAIPWVISGVVYIFPFFGLGATYGYVSSPVFKCIFVRRDKLYFILSRSVTTGLALCVICLAYLAIWMKIMSISESFRIFIRGKRKVDSAWSWRIPGRRDLRQIKRDLHVSRVTFITFMAFAVCFLPSTVQAYLAPSPGEYAWVTVQSLNHLQWIGIAISPWLPVLLTSNWRKMISPVKARSRSISATRSTDQIAPAVISVPFRSTVSERISSGCGPLHASTMV